MCFSISYYGFDILKVEKRLLEERVAGLDREKLLVEAKVNPYQRGKLPFLLTGKKYSQKRISVRRKRNMR